MITYKTISKPKRKNQWTVLAVVKKKGKKRKIKETNRWTVNTHPGMEEMREYEILIVIFKILLPGNSFHRAANSALKSQIH